MFEKYPLLSILITAYNREEYIKYAIQSVLNSNYSNIEVIVVDDCSTDTTVKIARAFEAVDKRITVYVNERNLGDYPNRNKAASYASGKYIKYLDSDDIIYPYSLNIMVDAMENNPNVVLGLSYYKMQEDNNPFPLLFSPEEVYRWHFLKGGLLFAGPSGSIISNDYFKRIGGFSGKRFVSDTELWLKIAQKNSVLILQPSLIWWRKHEAQEFKLGHLREEYVKLNFELNKSFLESSDCPLKQTDRTLAVRNYRNRFTRKIFKKIACAKFRDAREMRRYSRITIKDILNGIIPANSFRKILKRKGSA